MEAHCNRTLCIPSVDAKLVSDRGTVSQRVKHKAQNQANCVFETLSINFIFDLLSTSTLYLQDFKAYTCKDPDDSSVLSFCFILEFIGALKKK